MYNAYLYVIKKRKEIKSKFDLLIDYASIVLYELISFFIFFFEIYRLNLFFKFLLLFSFSFFFPP